MEIVSRQDAKRSGERYYFTGVSCKNGHTSKRQTSNCACYQCELDKSAKFRAANPEYHHNYNKQYYPENKNKTQKHSDAYYAKMKAECPDKLKEQQERVHKEYRKRNAAAIKKRGQQWRKHNAGLMNNTTAKRRAKKIQATPRWANLEKIKEIYQECEQINTICRMFGILEVFVVDHVVPLQGKVVSGLHVEANLRIVTATENCRKSNKLQEGLL